MKRIRHSTDSKLLLLGRCECSSATREDKARRWHCKPHSYFDFPYSVCIILHAAFLQVHQFTPLEHLPVVQFDFLVLKLVGIVPVRY